MLRRATACVLLLAALAACACTRTKEARGPRVVRSYSSPQECFDAFVAAEKDGDYDTYADCLSPQALRDAAAELALSYVALRDLTAEEDDFAREMLRIHEPVFDVMDRHGLTVNATRFLSRSDEPRERQRARTDVLRLIDDVRGFYVDARAAQDRGEPGEAKAAAPRTTLIDLETDGDRATGRVLRWSGEQDPRPMPTSFVLIDGSWRIRPWFVPDADE